MKKRRIYHCAPHCIGSGQVPSAPRVSPELAPLDEMTPERIVRGAIKSALRTYVITLEKAQWITITDARSADKQVCYICGAVCVPELRKHAPSCKLDEIIKRAKSLLAEDEAMATTRESILPAMPEHPRDDGAPRPKWNSKWDFDRAGQRVRIVAVAFGPEGEEETIDAREFIERLGEDHQGTTFAIHVETEQIGA